MKLFSAFVLVAVIGVSLSQDLSELFEYETILEFLNDDLFETNNLFGSTKEASVYFNYTTPELIAAAGYPVEIHHLTTSDGYILELHRIPYGRNENEYTQRKVAFVQHCLLCSSADYVMDKPDRALGFLLADAGYDVWLNNYRGNQYSRNHTDLDPEGRQFWQFSWDEMGKIDLPNAIDYTLSVTGETQVYYVGFSMGTTTFFVLMSEQPDFVMEKVKVSALMGPVAFMDDVNELLQVAANYSGKIDAFLSLLGYNEIGPFGARFDNMVAEMCDEDAPTAPVCYDILYLISGPDPEELNKTNVPVYVAHTPAGTSLHTLNHYAQLVLSGDFSMYDYGRVGNSNHYGQNTPPLYNLSGPSPPIGLYWGANDYLATPENVVRIAAELQNLVVNHAVEWEKWSHLDFIWGIHAKEYAYDHVMDLLSQY